MTPENDAKSKQSKCSMVGFCYLFKITPYSGEMDQTTENICFILSLAIIINLSYDQTVHIPPSQPTPTGPIKFYIYLFL